MGLFHIIYKILSFVKIAFHRKGGILYLLQKEASIASFEINSILYNVAPNIGTILDVGANIGQFGAAANRFFTTAQIFSFEPVPDSFLKLSQNTKKIANLKAYNLALGATNEDLVFYQNQYSHASSALKVSDYQKENMPKTQDYKEIKVKCFKLDDFSFNQTLNKPILLKLDVQGFEKQVIEGASNFINNVEYIVLEVSFFPMYDNEPLFDEMHIFLKEQGFELISPVGSLQISSDLATPQLDMLYRRKR